MSINRPKDEIDDLHLAVEEANVINDLRRQLTQQKAENERLRAAGHAMALRLNIAADELAPNAMPADVRQEAAALVANWQAAALSPQPAEAEEKPDV